MSCLPEVEQEETTEFHENMPIDAATTGFTCVEGNTGLKPQEETSIISKLGSPRKHTQ